MAKKLSGNKVGRPTVFTPELVTKLEQAFAIDASVEEACSYAEISRNAFYEYLKRNPQFNDRINDLRQRPVLLARQTAIKKIPESYQNAIDYLKRKRKTEFSERTELSGPDGNPIQIEGVEIRIRK